MCYSLFYKKYYRVELDIRGRKYYWNNVENKFEEYADYDYIKYECMEEMLHDFFLSFEPNKEFKCATDGIIKFVYADEKWEHADDGAIEFIDEKVDEYLTLDLWYFTKNIKEECEV